MTHVILSLLMPLAATPPLHQAPSPPPCPVLFTRILGPTGMRATIHPATPMARTFETPAQAGFRPGYAYRIELSDMAAFPGIKLHPSLEVRGMLKFPLEQAVKHPIPLVFSEDEIKRVVNGVLLTKVYYLEDPERAAPIQSGPDAPIVFEAPPGVDPMKEARSKGRMMIVVRLGEREMAPAELMHANVPNTIMLPGEQILGPAAAPPQMPWASWPSVIDPIAGPKPMEEECVPDGGDIRLRAGIGPDGRLGNLDPSDTAMEYTTARGNRKLTVSNRVCLCAPRFAVIRQELLPGGLDLTVTLASAAIRKGQDTLRNRIPVGASLGMKQPALIRGREQPSAIVGRIGLASIEHVKNVQIVGKVSGTKVVGKVVEPDEISSTPHCQPISLTKWADPTDARPGEIVTFFLKYHNHTTEPVTDLVISDSLIGRLDYVPNSARSDREATVTIQPNEAGSVIVRWQINGNLLPGQGGVVAFQAKLR